MYFSEERWLVFWVHKSASNFAEVIWLWQSKNGQIILRNSRFSADLLTIRDYLCFERALHA